MLAYVKPTELVTAMIDAGASKVLMSTRDTLIRAYMGGAILALGAVFAVTVGVQTGQPLIGALLFPVGFCMLYLLGYDLLTGYSCSPHGLVRQAARSDRPRGASQLGIGFRRQLSRRLHRRSADGDRLHLRLCHRPQPGRSGHQHIGESRTLGYAEYGASGMLTLFVRGMLCNWMVSTGVAGAMMATDLPGKVIAM